MSGMWCRIRLCMWWCRDCIGFGWCDVVDFFVVVVIFVECVMLRGICDGWRGVGFDSVCIMVV